MTHRLVYLIGAPGAGKSTLMARLTAGFDRVAIGTDEAPVAHDQLFRTVPGGVDDGTVELVGAELGVRRDLFAGTDALPSSVIDKAVPWIATRPYPLILAEGARLANKRFITAAADAGYAVTIAMLNHGAITEWRGARAVEIGREQNPAWVKGATTKANKLAEWAADRPGIDVVVGHPDPLFDTLTGVISAA